MGQKIEQKVIVSVGIYKLKHMSSKSTGLKRRESLHIVYHIKGLKKEKSHGYINRHRKSI